jgi:restriction endonuclease
MTERERLGPRLVAAVADYLSRHGYRTATNVSLRGRSGANYDVDVLAEKSDDVTTFRMMVDCKSWDVSVEKQALAGVHVAMTDLGINKAIVVSAKGWKTATEAGAKRLGIELWGPVDVEGRLERPGAVGPGRSERGPLTGLASTLARGDAEQVVRRQGRGPLGLSSETVVWFGQFWLPFYQLKVRHTREDKERFRKPILRTREFWNVYDGLDGSLYDQWSEDPGVEPVAPERLVRPRIPGVHVVNDIEETAARYNEATNPDATIRYEERLGALGIDLPVSFFDLSAPTDVYIPFYLSLLRGRDGQQRIVAIDASSGLVSEEISRIAMMNLDHILDPSAP